MRHILLAACTLAVLIPAAYGKDYQLPPANPAVAVSIPDDWKPTDTDAGVQANSPDGESYVSVETAPKKGVDALITDDIDFLAKSGVTFDKSSQKTLDTTVNGLPVSFLHWDGKDKDGPTSVTLVIVGVSDNLLLLMTAWSSPAGDQSNGPVLEGILKSFKKM